MLRSGKTEDGSHCVEGPPRADSRTEVLALGKMGIGASAEKLKESEAVDMDLLDRRGRLGELVGLSRRCESAGGMEG